MPRAAKRETEQPNLALMTAPFGSAAPFIYFPELCELIGLASRQTRTWLTMGKIPQPIKNGRKLRWHRAEISAWLAAGMPANCDWQWQPNKR